MLNMDKPLTASKWQILKAKVFGKRVDNTEQPTKTDKGCTIRAYWYKNVMYVTDFSEIPCQT